MPEYNFPPRGLTNAADNSMGTPKQSFPRSRFTNTFNKLTSFDAGQLIPFLVDEILPGDHAKYTTTAFLRMATPVFPIFSSQRIDTHFFFVPNRLLWVNWRQFMGQQNAPGDSIAFTIPTLVLGNFLSYSVYDYFGLPIGTNQHPVSALPFRAYRLIYQEWFRDENLAAGQAVTGGNGPDALSSYVVYQRAKTHDYFTSALPWPNKFTAPQVPVTGFAPVVGIGATVGGGFPNLNQAVTETGGGATVYPVSQQTTTAGLWVKGNFVGGSPDVYANLNAAGVGITVEAIRQAFAIQTLLERDARGGTRYTEFVKAQFDVTSPDARLQRPEYIGGGSTPLNVTPIAQTAPLSGTSGPLGSLGAAGSAVGSHSANYASTEHGYIIGIISVKSELHYQQALHKMFTRQTRLDFYIPAMANLGEQAILTREIKAANIPADFTVFGYQERWQEYRTKYSEITGAFRSGIAGTLDQWHLGEFFGAGTPLLNQTFIEDRPPMARVLAANIAANNQQYFADIQTKRDITRVMPMNSVPVSLDRF